MNVLLVDDEPTIRKMTRLMLQSRGFRVFDAANSDDALALSQQNPIDVLVTDVVMEGMDGPALARSLVARFPELPVLFISGHVFDVESERKRHSRCGFLPKPFYKSDLVEAISTLAGIPA